MNGTRIFARWDLFRSGIFQGVFLKKPPKKQFFSKNTLALKLFESSLVLTFAVSKEQIQSLLPSCLQLDTFDDKWAWVHSMGLLWCATNSAGKFGGLIKFQ
ncbi:MAG: hypothetical protein IPJ26_18780 [Bacteroidetes bacterium]|nr:hypothetical protein [Bacteroidota bacterium]